MFFFFFLMIMRMLGPWSSLVLWHWLIFSYLINQRVWKSSSWLIHWCRYEISYQWLIWYIFEKLVKWFFKLVNFAFCYISGGFGKELKSPGPWTWNDCYAEFWFFVLPGLIFLESCRFFQFLIQTCSFLLLHTQGLFLQELSMCR